MKQVNASEARIHLSRLLREVEKGRTITLVCPRRPIALIIPIDDRDRAPVEPCGFLNPEATVAESDQRRNPVGTDYRD